MKLLLALLIPFTANAATTGTLLLKGTVGEVLELTVNPTTTAANLDLTSTQTNTEVATVNIKSNNDNGYTLAISSANLGNLKRVSGTQVIPYTLRYNSQSIDLVNGQTFQGATGVVNITNSVDISYPGSPTASLVAGTYQDIVTFTVTAN